MKAGASPTLANRRTFLASGLALALAAATGCAPTSGPDPRPTTSSSRSGSPVESPLPTPVPTFEGGAKAAAAEEKLQRRLLGMLSNGRLSEEMIATLNVLSVGHGLHVMALSSPAATTRPTTGTPISPSPAESDDQVEDLVKAELDLAAKHSERALAATGFTALFWASLATAAATYADALDNLKVVKGVKSAGHRPATAVTAEEAVAEMVRAQHAAVYGYQIAIGQIPRSDKRRNAALDSLKAHRRLRDELTTWLIRQKVEVPVAEPAYVPPIEPTDAKTAYQLLAAIEKAVMPFAGLWVASAESTDVARAGATLTTATRTARRWGAPLNHWPGWQD